jgi:type IV secretory pathway TrbD component
VLSDHEQRIFDELVDGLRTDAHARGGPNGRGRLVMGLGMALSGFLCTLVSFTWAMWLAMMGLAVCYLGVVLMIAPLRGRLARCMRTVRARTRVNAD